MNLRLGLTRVAALAWLSAAPLAAQMPLGSAITYQGSLKDNTGAPSDGPVDMQFRLYDALSGGNQVGPTLIFDEAPGNLPAVMTTDSLFTVSLDFGAAAYNGDERYLEIVVLGETLAPRQRLAAAPYARHAQYAADSGGPWVRSGADLSFGTGVPTFIGNVGIGTPADAAYRLDIRGLSHGMRCEISETPNFPPMGVTGTGTALLAINRDKLGGTGIRGEASVRLDVFNPVGLLPAYGVYGYGGSDVFSQPGTPIPSVFGVVGELDFRVRNAPVNVDLMAGVLGTTNFTAPGVMAFGVYSSGPFACNATKSFHIDHPLDPENMTLFHYCSEGPEPLNIYSGNIVTDAAGLAWVQLPDYFESINRDFRYTLTIVDDGDTGMNGGFAQAKVAQKIKDNRFAIRTSQPNVEVSWEVKAVRNDRFVQRFGAPVEVSKGASSGKYLMPELYGQPKEKGIIQLPPSSPR